MLPAVSQLQLESFYRHLPHRQKNVLYIIGMLEDANDADGSEFAAGGTG